MKKIFILMLAALAIWACDSKMPFRPDDKSPDQQEEQQEQQQEEQQGEEQPDLPPDTDNSSYEYAIVTYDGKLATDNDDSVSDKSNGDIYWEAEAEADGSFKNTINVEYSGNDATVTFSKKAADAFKAEKNGANVVILPSGDEAKKCEIILSGSSSNGSLKIYNTTDPDNSDAGKKVKLTLNGVQLKSQSGPAINYQAGKRLFLHLAEGTDNSLEDAASYSDDFYYFTGKTSADEDRKGCFFSEKAVVVSGKGKLTVKGNYQHAISVDNEFYMRPGPTVVITGAAKNCLHCNDNIQIAGGYLYAINSSKGGKGIKSDSDLIVDGGRLVINTSGTYDYENNRETVSPKGIKIDGSITINGGDVSVRSTGSCEGSEGIESKVKFTLNGGKVNSLSYDDALNAATLVTINGGYLYCLSKNNDGIDSNGSIIVKGGTIISIASTREAALDSDNPGSNNYLQIDGGEVIGIGGAVYSPSSNSNQYCIVYNGCPLSTSAALSVKDSAGSEVLGITSPQGSQSAGVLLSSSKFAKSGTYKIYVGNTLYQTVTLSSKITTIGKQGGGGGGGFGPGDGPGGGGGWGR